MPSKSKKKTTAGSSSRGGFKRADSVISRRNQNGTVIVMSLGRASQFYKFDGIAAEIWTSMETPKSMESVVEHFSKRYPAKAKAMAKETAGLIKKLVSLDLLAESSGPFSPSFPTSVAKMAEFGQVQEFDLEQIETEVLNESVYLDVFAGSDLRLKSEIKPIRGALAKVTRLEGVTHRWRGRRAPKNAGLIAQQVAEQMPELVRTDRDTGHLLVNYQKLNSYLVEAIKELEARVRKLEAR